MAESFDTLIQATIGYLEQLKEQGLRFVALAPESLAAISPGSTRPSLKPVNGPSVAPARAPDQKPPTLATIASPQIVPTVESPTVTNAPVEPTRAHVIDEKKAQAIEDLRQRALQCVKCPHLASSRKNVVFGVGNIDADIMFVGEAPGADEDEQGEPFVGKAGQLLTRIIQTMGLNRDQVYIANILKCRPNTPGQSAGNRKPTPEEMQTCIPYLHAQIDLIQPKVLIALGATAVEGLLGKTEGITKLRGNWRTYRNIPLMPTYHPAYLLRNQALSEKRRVWEDILQVMEKIAMPITQKQRDYFRS
jgi:uracil-DNA glycosylase family 4